MNRAVKTEALWIDSDVLQKGLRGYEQRFRTKTFIELMSKELRALGDYGWVHDKLKEYEDINAKFAEPMEDDEMNALIERQAKVAERLDATGAWDLDSRLEMAMEALRSA